MPVSTDPARLTRVLDREGVVAAVIFGSRATGDHREGSDLDVGVWLDPLLGTDERLRLRLALDRALAEAGTSAPVDLVVLNGASHALRHRALSTGRRILDRDPRRRVRLETDALISFLDTAPLRATRAVGTRARIAEGRFGRR